MDWNFSSLLVYAPVLWIIPASWNFFFVERFRKVSQITSLLFYFVPFRRLRIIHRSFYDNTHVNVGHIDDPMTMYRKKNEIWRFNTCDRQWEHSSRNNNIKILEYFPISSIVVLQCMFSRSSNPFDVAKNYYSRNLIINLHI